MLLVAWKRIEEPRTAPGLTFEVLLLPRGALRTLVVLRLSVRWLRLARLSSATSNTWCRLSVFELPCSKRLAVNIRLTAVKRRLLVVELDRELLRELVCRDDPVEA